MFLMVIVGAIVFIIAKKKDYIKKRHKPIAFLLILLVLSLPLANVLDLMKARSDIRNNAVEQVEFSTAYWHKDEDILTAEIRVIPTKGRSFVLTDSKRFPKEMKNGTIVYGSRSKIILKYSGTVVEDWE